MKTYLECFPCFIRQALDAISLVTEDEAVRERFLRDVLRRSSEADLRQSPPAMGQRIHRLIRELTGEPDPYREPKERFNRLALRMLPELEELVEQSPMPLKTAVRLAIAGNVIDAGVNSDLTEADVDDAIRHAWESPLDGNVQELADAIAAATDILYLADNAGEIVFDRPLIDRIVPDWVTVVVRGSPILNDATLADARMAGITDRVEVIDNGSDAPGTILEDCSEAFRQRFAGADLIIAKGQGNYETLSDVDKDVFFLLKAKCPVIARDLGCPIGSLVLRRLGHAAATSEGEEDRP